MAYHCYAGIGHEKWWRASAVSVIRNLVTAVIVSITIALISGGASNSAAASSPVAKSKVNDFLMWLPPDSESLFVYKSFEIPKREPNWNDKNCVFTAWLTFSLYPLLDVTEANLYSALEGKRVSLAVEGSTNCQLDANNDMYEYEGCHIVLFENAVPDGFLAIVKTESYETFDLENFKVSRFENNSGGDVFVVTPATNLLIIATDKAVLATVLSRYNYFANQRKHDAKLDAHRAFPKSLPEWKCVDTDNPLWALRHFSKPTNDLASPLFGRGAVSDPEAIGATASYDGHNPKSFKHRYLTSAKEIPWLLDKKAFYRDGKSWTMQDAGAHKIDPVERWYHTIGILGHRAL